MPNDTYEYKPPHGSAPSVYPSSRSFKPLPKAAPKTEWEVTIPYGSEVIRKRVSAEDKTKAFRRVVMELSRSLNQQPAFLFKRIYAEKKYKVEPVRSSALPPGIPNTTQHMNSFIARANSVSSFSIRAHTPTVESDLERIQRLPLVESARMYQKKGNEVTYRATMPAGVKMHQVKELTGHLQNLFGARLLSSGPTQEKDDAGVNRDIVEVRTSLLGLV